MSESGHRLLMPASGSEPPQLLGVLVTAPIAKPGTEQSPRSYYAEMAWLPSLGPTALWAARRAIKLHAEERYLIETRAFAQAIGVNVRSLCRALDRLVMFRVADWDFDSDPRCPVLSMHGTWGEAPQRGLAAAYAFHPAERNTDGANSETTG